VPVGLTLAFAQVPPGSSVKVEPVGNWSFVPTFVVAPVVPPGCPTLSSTASITSAVAVATLLAGLPSFAAPVVPVKVTLVVGSSDPPALPGAV
jgi:hypothetical protein